VPVPVIADGLLFVPSENSSVRLRERRIVRAEGKRVPLPLLIRAVLCYPGSLKIRDMPGIFVIIVSSGRSVF